MLKEKCRGYDSIDGACTLYFMPQALILGDASAGYTCKVKQILDLEDPKYK